MSDNQEENKLIAERREKLNHIRSQGLAYGNQWQPENKAQQLQADFAEQTKAELEELGYQANIAGRIMAKRGPFLVIQDGTGTIQGYTDKTTQIAIKETWGQWDIGDVVGIAGQLFRSGKGDLYVNAERYELLAKALRPLPEKHAGLNDTEIRYRQRYVDLIVNPEVKKTFQIRSQVIASIRKFLNKRAFMEVETPMLHSIPGGATARPFVTHHNALDQDMYMRIAPELYLKRLVVGGFERVYEINRNFRNEGLSTRHNPEFTMLEFYQAYATFTELMTLTEDMLRELAQTVLGASAVPHSTLDAEGNLIVLEPFDFSGPFDRISVFDSILKYNPDLVGSDIDNLDSATAVAKKAGVATKDVWGLGKMQMEIFDKTVEANLYQPTFITEYPAEVSPLARRNNDDPFITDRFEFFVGGREIANGFSELNDPEDQAQRFLDQVAEKDAGDDEAMHFDKDYIRALEYGMPPTAGEGIGIDRLVMLLTNSASIRDVLLFPAMRSEQSE